MIHPPWYDSLILCRPPMILVSCIEGSCHTSMLWKSPIWLVQKSLGETNYISEELWVFFFFCRRPHHTICNSLHFIYYDPWPHPEFYFLARNSSRVFYRDSTRSSHFGLQKAASRIPDYRQCILWGSSQVTSTPFRFGIPYKLHFRQAYISTMPIFSHSRNHCFHLLAMCSPGS